MQTKRKNRFVLSFMILFLCLILLVLWNIRAGSVSLSVKEILKVLSGDESHKTAYRIVWELRMPRILAAILLGGALSVSGFLLQTFFGNPIAGPFVLGISSGAKLIVALVMIWFLSLGTQISSFGMILAAFVGSMLSMTVVLLVSTRVPSMSMLVVCGVMIGYICSAVTDFMITFADDSNIINLHNWSLGSFSGITWQHLGVAAPAIIGTLMIVLLLSKSMAAYQMGEKYAGSLGVNIRLFRVMLILCSSLLSACVTAFAGPISFVGIAVPHLVKQLLKTSTPLVVLPACFLGGGVFCLFCDLLARVVFAPTELSISSVTAIFGAPIVIYMMIKKNSKTQ